MSDRAPRRAAGHAAGHAPEGAAGLTGRIDRRATPAAARTRKPISARRIPERVRLAGEPAARPDATATGRIAQHEWVGLGIELLAAVSASAGAADGKLDPAPDRTSDREPGRSAGTDATGGPATTGAGPPPVAEAGGRRAYLPTQARVYAGRR